MSWIGKRHFIIPDTQVRPGVPIHHMDWIGQAIQEYRPDTIIHLGDHWDMPSLSGWSKAGSIEKEGLRYRADIDAGNAALTRLHKAVGGYRAKRKIILRGNHERRIARVVEDDARLVGALTYDHFNDRELGWEVVDYVGADPGQIELDGILYAHYFSPPMSDKAIGGTISNRLAKIGTTFIQGHQQGLQKGLVTYATGITRHGIVAGSCYLHDEGYKGVSNKHWRGVIVLNEVRDGGFSDMCLSLESLCAHYEGTSLARFLQRNIRGAKTKFSLARAA